MTAGTYTSSPHQLAQASSTLRPWRSRPATPYAPATAPHPERRATGRPAPDAIIVAPASYNTINKLAHGTADTYALDLLSENLGRGTLIVILPFVNSALAARRPFRRALQELRAEGVRILFGPGDWEPHSPGSGSARFDSFPWSLALREVQRHTSPTIKPTL
ncbi:flavoprotein [Fodinicola feengrottensis]|uniref:flavoprotein n=1 Tax=Fodinicola feengrottensis TaxID=435914 RepID=UPI0036F28E45